MTDAAALRRAHDEVYDGFLELAGTFTTADWDLGTGCPGWRVRDIYAHAIGIERWMLGDLRPDVTVPVELAHVGSAFAREVERDVVARHDVAIGSLLDELRTTFDRRRAWLADLSDDRLDEPLDSPFGPQPAKRILRTRVFDLYAHEQDVRRATARPGNLDGQAAWFTREQVVRALARTLPASVGDQGTVAIEVTAPRRAGYVIDLAAGSLTEPDGAATTTLRLTFADLVALGCGRSDADPAAVEVSGDTELGGAVLRSFAITP